MNTKQYFGVLKQFSFTKLLNIVVILSILLTSCGSPEKRATDEKPMVMPEKKLTENNYEPPIYTHPEPVIGERPAAQSFSADEPAPIQERPTQESGQIIEPSVNGTEVTGTPAVQASPMPTEAVPSATPMVTPSALPKRDSQSQYVGASQSKAAASAKLNSVTSDEMKWIFNGNAKPATTSDAIILTKASDVYMYRGSAWSAQKIDLNEDFDMAFNLYLGTDSNPYWGGGDGITFVMQNAGANAIGEYGMGLGYQGVSPSVAVEFDTFQNYQLNDPGTFYDSNHVALLKNGNMAHNGLPLVSLPNSLEDEKEHTFRFRWIASAHQLIVSSLSESGETILVDYTEDFAQTVFGGSSNVWFGFTGANANATNLEYFSVKSLIAVTNIYSSKGDSNISCEVCTQNHKGGPINTRTGGYDYATTDISIPSTTGEISFERTYSSLGVPLYSTNLGYGWTHNHDMYLVFGDYDTTTGVRKVTLKGNSANLYDFFQTTGSTTLKPYNGIYASLIQGETSFTLIDKAQNEYDFDLISGNLISHTNPNGQKFLYTYDTEGRMKKISDEGGQHYLSLNYSGSETRIASITDYTGREIIYKYDVNGDLVSATDLLAKTWKYTYDNWHHLTQVTDPDEKTVERTEYESNAANARAIRQYDGTGKLVVSLTYNEDGSTMLTDALGHTSTDYYNYRNTRNKDVDQNGAQTTKTYDSNFRPTTVTDADGDTTKLTWSANGANLTQVVDADGGRTDITYDALNNPITVIDALDHQTSYEYEETRIKKVTDAAHGETTYTYTPEGYLESVTDGEGVTTTYGYDSHGQRTSMTDELQNTWHYAYDDLGRLIDTTDPLERVTHNVYDAAGRMISVTRNYDPNRIKNADNEWNIVTEYEYDPAGNQTLVRDTLNRETRYEYDNAGRLIKTIDPELHETKSEYDEAGRLKATIDALQHHTYYFYDEAGRLKETRNELKGSSRTTYNPDGTVASTTDELDHTTYYTYDDLKRVTIVTQPGGGQTKNTYDKAGNLKTVEDSLGNITQYEYDPVGRLIKTIDPDLKVTESFYDDAGRLIQTVDARENHTTYTYDEAGRQKSVIDQLEGTTTYEYDEVGRRAAVIDANQNRTTYTYDQQDRVVAVTNASGTVYTEYDAAGQVLSRKDANGNKVEFTYTALGQLKTQKDAAGGTTTFGYDVVGNRISVQDANLHTTTMEYDGLNRLIKTIDPTLRETETVYDAAGQVVTTFDALRKPTKYEYNELGLQTKVIDPLKHETQYTYNAAGQMTRMMDANNVVTAYEYDTLGRLKTVIENYRAGVDVEHTTEINVRTEYTYDANGNRRTIKDGKGNVTTFEYDELNRLISEKDPLENSWTYGYDALGNRISMTDANGNSTEYTYEKINRLKVVNSIGTEADVSFSYDPGGRRTEMTDAVGTTTWNYDNLNRPISIIDPFKKTVGYTYDAVGNRIGLTYSGKEVQYTYDPANRLSGVSDSTKNTIYQYDPTGRLASISRPNGVNTTYSYDDAGRLIQLQHAAAEDELGSYNYTYDAVGNRIQAVESVQAVKTGPTVHMTVTDTSGNLLNGKEVYAFNGDTYTGYHQTTNTSGQVAITLPAGDYRFRVDVDGTKFWSGTENHCTIGQCSSLMMTIPTPVTIYVTDSNGNLRANTSVYAFIGEKYTGYHGVTNAEGALTLRLPEGDYRLRADVNGTQFWSQNACTVPTCGIVPIAVTLPVSVSVLDNVGMPHEGLSVYAFNGTTYTGKHAITDENGQAQMTLPTGDYRFRADFNGTHFWSGAENQCKVPDCKDAGVAVTLPLTITVMNTDGSTQQGIPVYAFNGTTYTGFKGVTDADGRVNLTLPAGNYHFRADLNGTQFWSDPSSNLGQNHCSVPNCSGAQITVTSSTTVTVLDTDGTAKAGLKVYAFNDSTYTGYHATTDANGQATLTLPIGSYRFRADYNGTKFWSGDSNHCDVPGCSSVSVTVTNGVLVTVQDTDGMTKAGVKVYAFNGSTYTGYNGTTDADGEVTLTLPQGSYRFRADYNGTKFWSGDSNHCDVPGCSSVSVTVTNGILVTVRDTDGMTKAGVKVYAFNGSTYTGYNGTTNVDGEVTLTLPQGSYRFRADYNGTKFWSGDSNHCDVPSCSSASVTVTNGILVTVNDTSGVAKVGLKVYAFNGSTYTGYNGTTNADGQVSLTLPQGSYRFRADYNGTKFWSGDSNHCNVPGCSSASVTVTNGVLVTVQDTDGAAKAGLKVYAFNGSTYTGYNGTTNIDGQVTFTLPQGSYRFRSDLNGTQFWSGASNHCDVPGCGSANVTVTNPVTVTVQDTDGAAKSGLKVYAFNGSTYTGYNGTTDANGQVTLTLQQGNYRFRADLNGTQFWSGASNHCDVPGCGSANVTVTNPITVTVQIADSTPQSGVKVYAFNGATYTGYSITTNASGQGIFTLPQGNYRFRADYNGKQYWSGSSNHCTAPGCLEWTVIVGPQPTATVTSLPTASATPTQTETPLPTATPTSTQTASPTTESTATEPTAAETPVPTETPLARLPEGNVFAVSFAKPRSFQLLPAKADTYGSVTVDEFDSTTLDPAWNWVVPLAGPTWSLINNPGFFQFMLPSGYDASGDINTAPSLQRTDMGTGDFAIETHFSFEGAADDMYQSGIMVGFSETDRLWMGTSNAQPVFLRIEKKGTEYKLYFKDNAEDAWFNHATTSRTTAVSYVGIFGDSYGTAGNVTYNVDYFRLEDLSHDVTVTVSNTDGIPQEDLKVYAFDNNTDTGISGITDANGKVTLTLPDGSYRFRTNLNGVQFWSGEANHCTIQGCNEAGITVSTQYDSVSVDKFDSTTLDSAWTWLEPQAGPSWSLTNKPSFFQFTLPPGFDYLDGVNTAPSLRRIDMGSGDFAIETSVNFETNNVPSDGYTYGLMIGFSETDRLGVAVSGSGLLSLFRTGEVDSTIGFAALPVFLRVEKVGTEYTFLYKQNAEDTWTSLASYTASPAVSYVGMYGSAVDALSDVTYNVDYFRLERTASRDVTVTVSNTDGDPRQGSNVSVFNGAIDTGISGVTDEYGRVTFTLPDGSYRFRADYNGAQFWSGKTNHCDIPGCNHAEIKVTTNPVTVTVRSIDYAPKEGMKVYAFDNTTYTGFSGVTNADGQVTFALPDGSYHFRTDLNGTQFWSGKTNHCGMPGCDQVEIIVTNPVRVKVFAYYGDPSPGVTVYAFTGDPSTGSTDSPQAGSGLIYTGYHQVTDEDGNAFFTLPLEGQYHFRIDYAIPGAGNSIPFWNEWTQTCTLPTCNYVEIVVTKKPLTVSVLDTDSTPKEGLNVYVFDGDRFTGHQLVTNANGQALFTLPYFGTYHFRTDLNGTQFWSGTENHCIPKPDDGLGEDDCESAEITVTKPITVNVLDTLSAPYPNLPVYAFSINPSTSSGQAYTGHHATTDANGQVTLTLPQGNYRFRADLNGTQFWSDPKNNCGIPGCESAAVTIQQNGTVIDYTYDPLYRLTSANYSTGDSYAYSYDSVGNRLRQESVVNGLSSAVNYNYDIANRLADVNGVAYTYDDNGNLLSDGANEYTYDPANRLTAVTSGQSTVTSYQYNGLGDRLSQNGVNYTLDLNTGLTQVLSDETTTYTYGLGRISQQSGNTPEYFLGDALGSVRQLTSQSGQVTYAQSYDPYGVVTQSSGSSHTDFGFTGESYDSYIKLIYLRSRIYSPVTGRFTSKDSWLGDYNRPLSLNRWNYTEGNPINYSDPSGNSSENIMQAVNRSIVHSIYANVNIPGSMIDCFLTREFTQKGDYQKQLYEKYTYLFGLTKNETINDLEAFAQLTEFAATLTPDCTECFIHNLGSILTGISNDNPYQSVLDNRDGKFEFDYYYRATKGARFGQGGYAKIFKDPDQKNGNQARHFWFYVQVAFDDGVFFSTFGNIYHEFVDQQEIKGHSFEDYALGIEGQTLALNLALGIVKPLGVGNYLRNVLAPDSTAANYWTVKKEYLENSAHPHLYDGLQFN
jgi:RHS repeat-associated protein